ncbi:hypothetical protein PHYSODRAFT_284523 [Phytophthora sojae]|uniref:C2H2-type domain-containing protein n=1 Tax=Phytophthora sojae (strain P6497) TaxID=1094619 RepID=G4YN61_PHYSP|nr:hypothetical protein PHYSODRAFT_284523 [Phytophthora sojae]EGZ29856.1 hypothetical protein PHYSODRAFT_284523 [Phytophthora sojae]|eukprot:XP_009517131.1 hypothetical protein PHYSODRAFT_284523 [Phytophthora sojae]
MFTCACSANFPTKGQRNSHRRDCKVAKAQVMEERLKDMTRPGSECDSCGRLYSMDDILYREKTMIIRLYEGTVICSDCAATRTRRSRRYTRRRSRSICRCDAQWPPSRGSRRAVKSCSRS